MRHQHKYEAANKLLSITAHTDTTISEFMLHRMITVEVSKSKNQSTARSDCADEMFHFLLYTKQKES